MSAGEREAAIKVNLDSAEFLGELRRMAQDVKKTSEESKRAFKGVAVGIDAAKSSMSSMANTAKQGLTAIATLGGAFSVGAAVKGAVELNAQYRSLADRAERAGAKMASAADIQRDVERAAALASIPLEQMQEAYDGMFTATGSLDFARDAINAVGTTATATRKDVGLLGQVASTLSEKFGVAAKDMDRALATVVGGTDIGGPKLEELAGIADQLGSNLLEAGLRGERGLSFMLGALNKVDDEMGGVGKSVRGMSQLLLNLGKGSEMKAMAKSLGINPEKLINEKDAIARLMKILSFGKKGLETLKANFVGPEERKALRLLFTDPFEQALNRAKASGLKGKDAVDQALKVLEAQIGDFGATTVTAAQLQKKAAENQKDPALQLTAALNTLKLAVAQPEVITGINDLAAHLPGLAKVLANFLGFAARHPILAGTLGIAGNAGTAFLGGFTRELAKTIWEGHSKGAGTVSEKITGGLFSGSTKAAGILSAAGRAFGVSAAALIAYQVGKELIDATVDPELKKTRDTEGGTEAAIANAAGGGSPAVMQERLVRLEKALETERAAKLGTGFGDKVAGMFGGPDTEQMSKDRLSRGEKAANDLRWKIREKKQAGTGESAVAMEPETIRGRVALDAGAPRQIASALVDGLGGRVLNVRLVNGGSGVAARSGGRGPINMPAPAHGGGT